MKINMKLINAAITSNIEDMRGYEWGTLVVPKIWNIEEIELIDTATDGHGSSDFYGQEIRIWKVTIKNAKKVKNHMADTFTYKVWEYTEEAKACALLDDYR